MNPRSMINQELKKSLNARQQVGAQSPINNGASCSGQMAPATVYSTYSELYRQVAGPSNGNQVSTSSLIAHTASGPSGCQDDVKIIRYVQDNSQDEVQVIRQVPPKTNRRINQHGLSFPVWLKREIGRKIDTVSPLNAVPDTQEYLHSLLPPVTNPGAPWPHVTEEELRRGPKENDFIKQERPLEESEVEDWFKNHNLDATECLRERTRLRDEEMLAMIRKHNKKIRYLTKEGQNQVGTQLSLDRGGSIRVIGQPDHSGYLKINERLEQLEEDAAEMDEITEILLVDMAKLISIKQRIYAEKYALEKMKEIKEGDLNTCEFGWEC